MNGVQFTLCTVYVHILYQLFLYPALNQNIFIVYDLSVEVGKKMLTILNKYMNCDSCVYYRVEFLNTFCDFQKYQEYLFEFNSKNFSKLGHANVAKFSIYKKSQKP